MNVKRNIIENIQERELKWYSHVQRMDEHRLPKINSELTSYEKLKQGMPKITWEKCMMISQRQDIRSNI